MLCYDRPIIYIKFERNLVKNMEWLDNLFNKSKKWELTTVGKLFVPKELLNFRTFRGAQT